jgi:hypothetical protein
MEIVILTAWSIWTMRNGVIFDGDSASLGMWKRSLWEEFFLSVLTCKLSKKPLLQAWLAQF